MCRAESLPQFPLNCRMDGLRTTGLLELFVLSCLKDPAEKKEFLIVVLLWSFMTKRT